MMRNETFVIMKVAGIWQYSSVRTQTKDSYMQNPFLCLLHSEPTKIDRTLIAKQSISFHPALHRAPFVPFCRYFAPSTEGSWTDSPTMFSAAYTSTISHSKLSTSSTFTLM